MIRIAYLSLVILFSSLTCCFGQVVKDSLLANQLNGMAYIDQKILEDILRASTDSAKQAITQQMQHIFDFNCKRIKEIFQQQDYPGWDRVGKEASHNFWLLVQHCDSDPTFQQLVLKAMKKHIEGNNADKGEIQKKDYAYLYDRVQRNTGKKQLYGTQLSFDSKGNLFDSTNKIIIPQDLADPANVDKRRAKMGLEPLEQYYEKALKMFGRPRKKE